MARNICVKPCLPPIQGRTVTVPFFPAPLKAQASLGFASGCDGCELVSSLLLQLPPLLGGLGLPICFLNCLAAVINASQQIPDAITGTPPDPSGIISALANVAVQCKCVVEFALPPIGAICDFLKMVRDVIGVCMDAVLCIKGLLQHLFSIHLKAVLLTSHTAPEMQSVGLCLLAQVGIQSITLLTKFGNVMTLLRLIEKIFEVLQPFAGAKDIGIALKTAVDGIELGLTVEAPPIEALGFLDTLSDALGIAYAGLQDLALVCG